MLTAGLRAPRFKARIAFKLVWCPPAFKQFVLVDDGGALLATGTPTGTLPPLRERQQNYAACRGGRYAAAAEGAGTQ